ncbi:MAG: 6-phosphogluconolactonase [Deltaproteobacteria bacterium]|nr:6-phosphogluconolactonase [Deltaproteobacteria bacterium]
MGADDVMRVVLAEDALPETAAGALSRAVQSALLRKPRVSLALSGGRTPLPALARLARADLDWTRVDIYQVDERIAPAGDPARNLVGLATALLDHVPASLYPMRVEAPDIEDAAERYAADLPGALDVVHLGIGDDGHTASLVPGDPVLDVTDRQVAITQPYRGHRRMTLTFPALNRARAVIWIVSGASKAPMVERLLAADPTIPAGRVSQDRALLITDRPPRP